jgi:hypothetical protein
MSFRVSLIFILLLCASTSADAQRFLPDDPLIVDDDRLVNLGQAHRRGLSDYYDFLHHTFATPGNLVKIPAENANTLGEVPDSSWFQNRHGQKRMTIDELVRGPNTTNGPSAGSPWNVTDGKTEGITPGFRIRDSRGDVYLIKFDPQSNPEMATAAELISTKFFFAAGYNVPENYLVFFQRSDLVVDANARISEGLGPERRMSEADLDRILARVDRMPDGRYRAVASKFLNGSPIGPFKYYGTRSDDPNDVIPHEHRRELRGLGVLSAWLNHDDSRAVNTLDSVEATENRQSYIRHYLIDFGSTLGSGSVQAQKPRAGWEYLWEPVPVFRRIFTLGLWDSSWIRIQYPDMPSIGRFESKVFDPERWKPEYPNPAFMNALPDDSYWAAKIVMSFTDEDIRAVVRSGGLTDPQAEQYLIETLIERRNKIGRHYLGEVLSIDHLRLNGSSLEFDHLSSLYDFSNKPPQYTLAWFRFDNDKDEKVFVGAKAVAGGPTFSIPPDLQNSSSPYFGVEIEGESKKVTVFMHRSASLRIVGIERSWNAR